MDEEYQPQPLNGYVYPDHDYIPGIIEPCATLIDEHGEKICNVFHLLTCGHIIAIDEKDQRCGINCQHTATLIASHRPQRSHTQNTDRLYCETCHGIPFDRYKIMASTEEGPPTLRRSLALTGVRLQSAFGLHHEQINALLCPPFFDTRRKDFDWNDVHRLRCGHDVWSAPMRPCAANCTACTGAESCAVGRQGDAILCQECMARAELMFQRYAVLMDEGERGRSRGRLV